MFVVRRGVFIATLFCLIGLARPTHAQSPTGSFEIGPNLSVLHLSEIDTTDVGIGVDASWHLMPHLTIDGSLALFPGGGEDPSLADQRRTLGLIGVRSGITRGRIDFYGRGRIGVLSFAETEPQACILIFPAPLSCQLAGGHTAFAMDIGGGAIMPLDEGGKWRLRLDLGDLLVRYGLEGLRSNGKITDGFISHNLLLSAGVMWRF